MDAQKNCPKEMLVLVNVILALWHYRERSPKSFFNKSYEIPCHETRSCKLIKTVEIFLQASWSEKAINVNCLASVHM